MLRYLGGQILAYAQNKPKKELSVIQARALAELSTIGLTDLSYNNIYFTQDGKVAILDTEPLKRGLKKAYFANRILSALVMHKDSLLAHQALTGTAKLKSYCLPQAREAVENVEKKLVLWTIARLTTKIALGCLVFSFTPSILALIPLSAYLIIPISLALKTSAVMKSLTALVQIISLYFTWSLSHNKYTGLTAINQLEQQGYL